MEELISRVFAARDIAHREHLRTKSYEQHVALGAFYEDVIEAADAAAEVYQGMFGIMDIPENPAPKVKDVTEYLRDEAEWIESNREIISGGANSVGNLVDNITAVYLKALYKLENLK